MIAEPYSRPSYVDDDDPAFDAPLVFDGDRGLLAALEQEIRRTKVLLDVLYERAHAPGAEPKELPRYLQASQTWSRLVDQYTREKERVDAVERDRAMSAGWQQETEELADHLSSRYGAYGPQYLLLCQIVAPLVIKLRKSYAGGLRLSPAEQTSLTDTANRVIAQLQKHTESTKTETQVHAQIAAKVLSIIEPKLTNQPKLWQSIIEDIKLQVQTPAGELTAGGGSL